MLLKEVLEASDEIQATILHAERLERAIWIAANNKIDVTVIDLSLPDSFGMDTFCSFHRQFPLMPAIIMTGTKDHHLALESVKDGAQDYLFKGELSSTAIIRTIRHAIERQSLMTNLEKTKQDLQRSLFESEIRENEIKGLLKGARAVLEQKDFKTTARKMFDICAELIGATSGYVALLSDDGAENEVLFLEAGGRPCSVDPELPMPIRGLRAEVYHTHCPVYDNDFMNSEWVKYMPEGHVKLKNVLFAPLNIGAKTVGVMGLANKPTGFTKNDAEIASGLSELAAIALQNSRNLDKRDQAEQNSERLISELQAALSQVKKLSGMLPICSVCKKIRDDKGYWKQIETYIHEHSEAEFTHGICRECADQHYPELGIYDDE